MALQAKIAALTPTFSNHCAVELRGSPRRTRITRESCATCSGHARDSKSSACRIVLSNGLVEGHAADLDQHVNLGRGPPGNPKALQQNPTTPPTPSRTLRISRYTARVAPPRHKEEKRGVTTLLTFGPARCGSPPLGGPSPHRHGRRGFRSAHEQCVPVDRPPTKALLPGSLGFAWCDSSLFFRSASTRVLTRSNA